MVEVTTMGPVKVGPIVDNVHLVHPHGRQPVGSSFELVEETYRLTVRDRHDQLGSGRELLDQGLGQHLSG